MIGRRLFYFLGLHAKNAFDNFKKRYMKKKNAVKKADRSGTSSISFNKAKKDLEPYLFFSWYDEFSRPRASKTNIKEVFSDSESFVGEDVLETEEQVDEDQEISINSDAEKEEPINITTLRPPQEKKSKIRKDLRKEEDDDLEMMKGIARQIQERRSVQKTDDAEDLYCKSLAIELRKFSERERYVIKHEFNEILFKHNMNRLQSQSTQSHPPQHYFNQPSFSSPSPFSSPTSQSFPYPLQGNGQ